MDEFRRLLTMRLGYPARRGALAELERESGVRANVIGRYAVPKYVGMRLVQVVGVLRQSHRRGVRLGLVQGVPVTAERRLIRLVAELDHYPRYLSREAAVEALFVLRRVNWLPRWERPARP